MAIAPQVPEIRGPYGAYVNPKELNCKTVVKTTSLLSYYFCSLPLELVFIEDKFSFNLFYLFRKFYDQFQK